MDEKHVLHRFVIEQHFDANEGVRVEAFMPTKRDEQPDGSGSYHLSVIAGSVRSAEEACRLHDSKVKMGVAGCVALCQSDVETIENENAKLKVINDGKKDPAHRSIVIPPPVSMEIRAHHKNIAKRLLEQAKKNGDEHGFYYVYIAA